MLLAPLHWPVQLVAWLPDYLRPAAFCVLVLIALWFVFIQRGLPNLWHALCRAAAVVVDATVGLLLLPEYMLTTARQNQQQQPGQAALAFGTVAERVLDGAGSLHQRHLRDPIAWKRPPWIPLLIVFVVLTVPWVVMELTSPRSVVRQELAQGYEVWRDVEAWADVDPARRAAAGIVWPPRPQVMRVRRHRRTVGVTLRCQAQKSCHGRVILRSGKGQRLHSRLVVVPPNSTRARHMKLSREDAKVHHVLARVARAEPE
jgi:hypothetical protein